MSTAARAPGSWRPPRLRSGLPAVLWGLAAAACLVLVVLLGARVFTQLAELRRAPQDNVQWSVAQLETELLRLQQTGLQIVAGEDVSLDEFRQRFDIFYSRVDVLRSGTVFAPLRRDFAVQRPLLDLSQFLEETVPIIDGPDDELQRRLPELLEKGNRLAVDVRDLELSAVATFARASDAQRSEFAALLSLTAYVALGVIVVLIGAAVVLLRQTLISRRREAEIRQNEERLAAMVNAALDAVIVIDSRGTIIEFNTAAETIFGITRDAALGRQMGEMMLPARHRAAHEAGLTRYLKTGETVIVDKGRIELTALNAKGEEFPIELSVGRSQGKDGPIFIGYLRDITNRKRSENELRVARDRAQAADRAKSEFLAVMSHEMRTPLNGVLGALDLLRATPLEGKQAHYVDLAAKSGEILLSHINDVLDITKIEAGKLEIETEPFDVRRMVIDLAETTKEEALKRDNQVVVTVDPGIAETVLGDPYRVRQILLNMVANAIKFTSEGTITIKARLARDTGDAPDIEFSVRDTGIGISEADIGKLFSDFVTLDPAYARTVGGTGLGLAICRRLVKAMGGEIGVDSTPGKGSRRLSLPPRRSSRPRASASSWPKTTRPTASSREMLSKAGNEVTIAEDGVEAVKRADETPFDVILMDVSMPRMDGLEATKRIRQGKGASQSATIIAVTAHALPAEIERFLGGRHAGLPDKAPAQA
jgi:PAS domain S-box-containing protein